VIKGGKICGEGGPMLNRFDKVGHLPFSLVLSITQICDFISDSKKENVFKPGVVAYFYNPSYLGGKDQNCGLRPVEAKSEISCQSVSRALWSVPVIPADGTNRRIMV
jgi:hypothetical protein